ncbi:MAG: hypothetical protein H0X34_09585 [Chthoniobacterales bacterium]|nr:hypothetical protein [Chthoniobacterales bacterium]
MKYLTRLALSGACFSLLTVPCVFATLTLTTSTGSIAIPFLATDYNASTGAAQVIKISAQTLTILSTSNTWTLNVRALSSTFSFAPSLGDSNPNKPAADLVVRAPVTSSTWLVLSTTNQVLSTGPKSASNQTRVLDYRLNSNLSTNPPGSYTLSVVYTLTSP